MLALWWRDGGRWRRQRQQWYQRLAAHSIFTLYNNVDHVTSFPHFFFSVVSLNTFKPFRCRRRHRCCRRRRRFLQFLSLWMLSVLELFFPPTSVDKISSCLNKTKYSTWTFCSRVLNTDEFVMNLTSTQISESIRAHTQTRRMDELIEWTRFA